MNKFPVDLATISQEEQLEFLNSFDQILSDVDGVVAFMFRPIEGASECVKTLKRIGKKISYVTNHGVVTREKFQKNLGDLGIEVEQDDLFTPPRAIIWHLKKENFNRRIYVIGTPALVEELTSAGYKTKQGPGLVEPNVQTLYANLVEDKEIGAVVIDTDINVTFINLQKAIVYLRNDDVLFVSGAQDARIPISKDKDIIGPYFFINALEELSGRTSQQLAKPSPLYNQFIVKELKITNPRRVLFIGDAIRQDMGFATQSGYQKLLVFSGTAKKTVLEKWEYPEEWKPKYYVDSLKSLNTIITKLKLM